jgi:hypothetical protein
MSQIRLWKWQLTDEVFGTPRVTRRRLSDADVYASLKDAVKVEHSLGGRIPTGQSTSDFLRSLPKS